MIKKLFENYILHRDSYFVLFFMEVYTIFLIKFRLKKTRDHLQNIMQWELATGDWWLKRSPRIYTIVKSK